MPTTLKQNVDRHRELRDREAISASTLRHCWLCDDEMPINKLYWYDRQSWLCRRCHPNM